MAISNGVTAAELMQMELGTQNFIIPSMLTEGLNLLGARKGEGKSFMALDMAVAVASGSALWGRFDAGAGDVLFLGLEDTPGRIKRRLQMRGGFASDRITFFTMLDGWNRLDEGGLVALNEWMVKKPTTKLIVLDTVGRVVKVSGSYDSMTKAYGDLSRFGHAHHVAVLATHHLVKTGSKQDPFSDLHGSVGIGGASDTLLLLDRPRFNSDGRLYTTGKDVEEVELGVRFDNDHGTWSVIGQASDVCASEVRQRVREIVANSGAPMSPEEIRLALAKAGIIKSPGAIRVLLSRMATNGELHRSERGRYTIKRPSLRLLPMLQIQDEGSETCNLCNNNVVCVGNTVAIQ